MEIDSVAKYLSMCKKRYQVCATQSLSISVGMRLASSSGTLKGGKDGPYVNLSSLKIVQKVEFSDKGVVKSLVLIPFKSRITAPGGESSNDFAPLLHHRGVVSPIC